MQRVISNSGVQCAHSHPALQQHLEVQWELLRQAHDDLVNTPGEEVAPKEEVSQFQTFYEKYNMTLLRENDDPMSLNLSVPPLSIP